MLLRYTICTGLVFILIVYSVYRNNYRPIRNIPTAHICTTITSKSMEITRLLRHTVLIFVCMSRGERYKIGEETSTRVIEVITQNKKCQYDYRILDIIS